MAKEFNGELIHFHTVRMRVTGSGNLQQSLLSLDDVNTFQLADLVMSSTTNREPTTLVNYIDQRGRLRLETTEIDEVFNISKIIIYVKAVASGYPQ